MSHRHNHYSDFELDVDVDLDHTTTVNKAWTYTADDEDLIDIDIQDDVDVDQMLVSVNGDIDYSPGDDISVEEILNESLNGAGNDTGIVMNNSNQVSDADYAAGTSAANNHNFNQTATATGGEAKADDGIASGGGESGGLDGWHDFEAVFGGHGHGVEGEIYIEGLEGGSGGDLSVRAGDDALVEGLSSAEASAANDTAAFTNTLIQGQNILNNSLDVSVVGGNMTSHSTGDDLIEA
ncbi:MAG: hypothetical protein ABJJ37_05355 [Roseibium sp.]